jgi:hypothetical protein
MKSKLIILRRKRERGRGDEMRKGEKKKQNS